MNKILNAVIFLAYVVGIAAILSSCAISYTRTEFGDVRDRRGDAFIRIDSLYRCGAITAEEAWSEIRDEQNLEGMELQ